MARDRQKAKRRQAERRAARLAERRRRAAEEPAEEPTSGAGPEARGPDGGDPLASPTAGAPPEDAGRSDKVLEPPASPLPARRDPDDEELLEDEAELEGPELDDEARRDGHELEAGEAREAGRASGRGRVLAFLAATWAELQRVQWPNRQAVTTLTGVVLGFVLLAGGYLGVLDFFFSRLVQSIL